MISTVAAFFAMASSMMPRRARSISWPLLKMSCRSSFSFTRASLCVFGFAEPFLDPADGVVVVGVPLHRGGQPQVRQRLTESAGPLQGPAEHVVRVVVRRIMLDQRAELGLGAGQLRGVERPAGQQL